MRLLNFFKSYLTPDEKKKIRNDWVLAVISGLFFGLSFPPIPFYFLIFGALVPLLIVWKRRSGLAEISRITYIFGFVFTAITLYWVGSWQPQTDPFLMIAGVALLFFNPLVFLIPSTLFYMARKVWNDGIAILFLPAFWVTYEYLYSITDLRFPWLTLGHGLAYFKSFIQISEIIGTHGLSFLVILINVFVYLYVIDLKEKKKINLVFPGLALVIILFTIIYGNIRINNFQAGEKHINIGLIQPNLNPWNKWDIGNLNQHLDLYLSLSQTVVDSGADIIIWPETALPVYFLSGSYFAEVNRLKIFTETNQTAILTGMPHAVFYRKDEEYPSDAKRLKHSEMLYTSFNSILLFDPGKEEVAQYGKIMLVPFGERVPFLETIPILGDIIKWNVGISSWNVGRDKLVFNIPYNFKHLGSADTIKTAGVICIESIYSDFVAGFVEKGAQLIAVVTNDSWYGDSSGPYQHKEISVLRAVENRRSVVRAANGGISCLIDPLGNIIAETKMYERDALNVNASIESELTFFTKHPLLIIRLSYVISTVIVLFFIFVRVKEKYFRNRKSHEENY